MKVMSIFGTRPEIIRLSRIFAKLETNFEHIMVNTNQNFTPELNRIFFKDLKIRKPDYNLKVNTENYGKEIGEIIEKSEKIILKEKPDVLLILGDTNSGLSAIPASHHGIKIVHLEAGMRAYDFRMPEEKNRVLIDHLSSVLLPYTNYSRENLIRENIHTSKIYVVGNPIIEVINYFTRQIENSSILEKMKLGTKDYFLITAHRSENVDDPKSLEKIFSGLEKIHLKFKKRIIYPIHPRTLSKIKKKIPKCIECVKPLGFFDFTKLEKNAFCIITDSGTVPEEALFFGVPCVTIRESTERPEYIEAGGNILSGLEPDNLVKSVKLITSSKNKLEW
ncbi:MAG: non-hydrolyzing UDP-N-acetylglucosamine 2-epimerase, partial [Candidatus Nitrosomaritimum yanchengensis]